MTLETTPDLQLPLMVVRQGESLQGVQVEPTGEERLQHSRRDVGQAQKLRDTFPGRTRHRCDLGCVQPLCRKGAVGRQFFLNRHRLALRVLGQTDFDGHGLGL